MAMGVVNVFEMVEVGQDDGESIAAAILAGTFAADGVQNHAAIADSGEIVVGGAE